SLLVACKLACSLKGLVWLAGVVIECVMAACSVWGLSSSCSPDVLLARHRSGWQGRAAAKLPLTDGLWWATDKTEA
ncbi:hypothetical protein, partial [Shewanella baltica]|uniref:hypothetical protein n=1 Tax=Shewanella baltica TaxID=62322 RepID=UPI00055E2ED6